MDPSPDTTSFKVVLLDYLIGHVGQFHFDVFGPFEWFHEVEVGDVHCHELGSFGRDDAVEDHLGD